VNGRDRLLRSAASAPLSAALGRSPKHAGFRRVVIRQRVTRLIKKGTPVRGRRPRFIAGRGAGLRPVAQTTGMASTYSCVPCLSGSRDHLTLEALNCPGA
jgi:hypothetical protein